MLDIFLMHMSYVCYGSCISTKPIQLPSLKIGQWFNLLSFRVEFLNLYNGNYAYHIPVGVFEKKLMFCLFVGNHQFHISQRKIGRFLWDKTIVHLEQGSGSIGYTRDHLGFAFVAQSECPHWLWFLLLQDILWFHDLSLLYHVTIACSCNNGY